MKNLVLFGLTSLIFLACKPNLPETLVPPQSTNPLIIEDFDKLINIESDFIMAHQLENGALTMSGNRDVQGYKIVPYFSNVAARALLANPTPARVLSVKKWMVWYMTHLNSDGSVYDYYASDFTGKATLTSTGDFDSIDSYAATFLTLARLLCESSPTDKDWLKNNYSTQLKKVGEAIIVVMQNDGLSIAKPTYAVKYTMDNAEVNKGMEDMVWLSRNVILDGDIIKWQTLLRNNTNGIETGLWDKANDRYFWYEGSPISNWGTFYADATCQLYPIWCGVILPNSGRAANLWNLFNTNYPDWPNGKIYDAGGYPWAVVSYVAALMNDKGKAASYLSFVQSFTDAGKQPTDNWYNFEAAFVILAAKKMN